MYVNELKARLHHAHESARKNIISSKESNKTYYDKSANPSSFKPGNFVYLKNEAIQKGQTKKLSKLWNGPYEVLSTNGVNSSILINKKPVTVHNNRLKPG